MGSNVTPTMLRGFIVPDPRITYADAYSRTLSTVSPAGPRPGVPEAQADSDMVLDTSGTMTGGTAIEIRGVKGGNPGIDEASYAWRPESANLWRGWDPPNVISDFEFLDWTTTGNKWLTPHAITLDDGTIVAVTMKSNRYVVAWRRNPSTGAWTEVEVHDNATTYTNGANPTILKAPDGRLQVYFWQEDTSTSQVRMQFSDDDGVTWSLGQKACLAEAVSTATYTPGRLRAAMLRGEVLLVAAVVFGGAVGGADDILFQYASADEGATFELVEGVDYWTGASVARSAAYPDVITVGDQFLVTYIRASGADVRPYLRLVANPFEKLSGATEVSAFASANSMRWATLAAERYSGGDLSVWLDDEGTLYMVGRDVNSADRECYVQRSLDNGQTWATTGDGPASGTGAHWWRGQDANTHPRSFAGTAQGGRSVILCMHNANPETHDDSISAVYLGGYATIPMPGINRFPTSAERTSWVSTWLPFDLPENTGGVYTVVTGGAPTVAMTSTGVRLTGGAGDSYSWNLTAKPTSTLAQGLMTIVDMRVVGGSGFIDMRIANATPVSYSVRVTVTTTTITLRDLVAGADIGTAENTTAGVTGVQILIGLGNADAGLGNTGKVYAYWRPAPAGADGDRAFELIGSTGTSSTLQAGASANNDIQWGMLSGTGTDVTVKFHGYSYGAYTGQQIYPPGPANPQDLLGRSFSTTGGWVDDGVKLIARDGAVFQGQEWLIRARYEHGPEHLHTEVSRSPRRGLRTVNDDSGVELVWVLESDTTEDTLLMGPAIGLALLDCNFRTFTLYGRDGTGAWVSLLSGDTAPVATGLTYTRDGAIVRPGAATSATLYYPENILAGSYFSDGTAAPNTRVRKILGNSPGAWPTSAAPTTIGVRLRLEGTSAADSAGLATGQIWSKDYAAVVNGTGRYSAYKLTIPAQITYEGYFRLGKVLLGSFWACGWQPSRGRSQGWEPNTRVTTSRSGTRRVRNLGPTRRTKEIAWEDGVDVSQLARATPSPDYVTAYTGSPVPIAAHTDTPYSMAGLIERCNGPETPVVYLPSVPVAANSSTPIVIVNRAVLMYGSFDSESFSLDTALGNEWEEPGEVLRSGRVLLVEEV